MLNIFEQPWTLIIAAIVILLVTLIIQRSSGEKQPWWQWFLPVLLAAAAFGLDMLVQTDLEKTYAEGGNANDRICYVAVATTTSLYVGQEDGDGDVIDRDDIGAGVDIIRTVNGNTAYGTSGMELDSDTAATD